MGTFITVILVILFICIDVFLAFEFKKLAAIKGWNESKYFWYCIVFTIAGYILVAGLPAKDVKFSNAVVSKKLPTL